MSLGLAKTHRQNKQKKTMLEAKVEAKNLYIKFHIKIWGEKTDFNKNLVINLQFMPEFKLTHVKNICISGF